MSLTDLIQRDPDAETLKLWLKRIPYASYLGIEADVTNNDILFKLPPDEKLIGNASLPALHGGVVGAFMELAGAIHLVAKMDKPVLPKVINFSLDYLRASRVRDTFARFCNEKVKPVAAAIDQAEQYPRDLMDQLG